MNFATFILSLATSAQVHLGMIEDPVSKKKEARLPLAKQTIDILEMLEVKTKGNLEEQEGKLFEQVLFELRMQYLEIKDKKSGSGEQKEEPKDKKEEPKDKTEGK